jgi:YD repeat-containing protein
MVAIVTGTGLGLERSSGSVFGARGSIGDATFGQFGENVTVNAATGNLVINRTDEILIGLGPDSTFSRNYNSLGTLNDDNGDNWRLNVQRAVTNLTGTINTAGSTVTRIDWDGSDTLYSWDTTVGAYVCKQGTGAYDTLTLTSNTWTWTDGSTRATETYDKANGGRITTLKDADGNKLSFTYTGSQLTRVTTKDAEYTDLIWSGNNLMQLVTTLSGGTTVSRVSYTYDASNRLSTVTTDLTPGDNSTADGAAVVTTYGYIDDTSRLVGSISQTGGARLDIGYDPIDTGYRVTSLTQTTAAGTTSTTTLDYDTFDNITSVTDAQSQTTDLYYTSEGQLSQIVHPAVQSAPSQIESFGYDADGDVMSVTDAAGKVTSFNYDANGNLIMQRDAGGNTITRTYGTKNELLTETTYSVSDPDGAGSGNPSQPVTKRFAYDAENHLRFILTQEREVTEFVYDSYGRVTSSIIYRDNKYDQTAFNALALTDSVSEATLSSWASSLPDRSSVEKTDTVYDFRSNISTVTSYSSASSTGVGQAPYTKTIYVYDQFGNLLSRHTNGLTNSEIFTYDGLGRVVARTDLNNATTNIVFSDSQNQVVATLANGLVQTSTYNLAGQLISYAESGSGIASATTTYKYDNLGRLRMVTDAAGRTNYYIYDVLGRKALDVAPNGQVIQYRYDAANRLVSTYRSYGILSAATLASLVDANGNPVNGSLQSFSIAPDSHDRWEWRVYDSADRLIETIDGTGSVKTFAYDGRSNLIQTTSYYNRLSASTVTGFKTTAPTTLKLPTANASKDNVSRNFYDGDGRLIGALDGDGFLRSITYNEAGEKTETIAFATAANSSLRATGTFTDLLASVGTSSLDQHDRYFYDGRGLLRYSLDAVLQPTEYVYDAVGSLLHTTHYAGAIASTTSYNLAYVQAQISANLSSNTGNRMTSQVYDGAGRVAYTIDANLAVVQFRYDSQGRVIKQTAFAGLSSPTTGDYTLATMESWAGARASYIANRVTRTVYDTAGRVAYTAIVYGTDGKSYVTEYRYDTTDKMTATIRYADAYTVDDSVTQSSMSSLIGSTIPASAAQSAYSYDALGRLSDSYDAAGTRTGYLYDALDQLVEKIVAYGVATDNVATYYTYDVVGRLASETQAYSVAEATTTTYSYDGLGNLLTKVDGRGFATTYTYDALGQVLTESDKIDATNTAVTTYTYDAFGNALTTKDPRGYTTYSFYDNLDRLILQIDRESYATATAYTFAGEVASVTRFFTKVSGTITPGIAPTPTVNATEDATTSFIYDKMGRVTRATDAMGFYENYTLDAFGNRTSIRNKLGGVTTNTFDLRGLLTSETLPINSVNSQGTVVASSVTNRYEYDARGNCTKKTEAAGLAELRTTSYRYDLLDRVVEITGDQIQVVNRDLTTSTITPKRSFIYDRRGNVIEMDDASGARTLYYYDALDRKTVEIDAAGTVRTWTYDANGNAISARTYGSPVAQPTTPGGQATVSGSVYREITFSYDGLNRLVTTTIANILNGRFDGANYVASTGNISTNNYYDKDGNLTRQDDALGNSQFFYYDKLGRKIAQVDQQNYLTYYTLDADGSVSKEERFWTPIPSTTAVTVTSSPSTLRSSVAGLGADRTTTFTYDLNGRRTSETRLYVYPRVIDAAGNVTTASDSSTHIYYAYNGLGEVTSKTEATGDVTAYGYDVGGRLLTVTGPSFTDYTGATVQRVTQNYYDGLNDLTRTVDNSIRVATYSYGPGGRLASMTDATGFTHSYGYDAIGNVVLDQYTRLKSDGVTALTEGRVTVYDVVGRVMTQAKATFDGTVWRSNYWEYMLYNAYGDLTKRGANGLIQETFDYDGAGRLIRSTAGDGTVKLFVYDAAGNQTMAFTPTGRALPTGYDWQTLTASQALALTSNGSTPVAGIAATMSIDDKRGQTIETRDLARETTAIGSAYTDISRKRTYNAFGEVMSETDARGNTTSYSYDNRGKLYTKTMAAVSVTAQDGTTSTVNPIEYYYYDASGRLIVTRDANGYQTKRTLLAGTGYDGSDALTVKEFHPDGGVVTNGYDALLNLRKTTNEIGQATAYYYDLLGHLTQVTHPLRADSTQLSDFYAYDGLGQRTAHWNSQLGVNFKELTDYDYEGQVTKQTDLAGHATYYVYGWDATKSTSGLGTFGGWIKQTQNAAGLISTDVTDYFGREIYKIDFGGHTYSYTFDQAGRVTLRDLRDGTANTTILDEIIYAYFNTGLVATISASDTITNTDGSSSNRITAATYKYDVSGNRTNEDLWVTSSDSYLLADHGLTAGTYQMHDQNSVITWDALNRMTSYTDSGENGGTPATISYQYDANGNVRHVAATYRDLVSNSLTPQDYWYKYDVMNRFVTTKGVLSGGVISRGSSGTDVTYNAAGQRMSATGPNGQETYSYTEDGYLATVKLAGTLRAQYSRDTMGRATSYTEYDASGIQSYSKQSTYNRINQLTDETVAQANSPTVTTHYDYTINPDGALQTSGNGNQRMPFNATGAYAGGMVTHTISRRTSDNVVVSETENFYTWWDEAKRRYADLYADATGNVQSVSNFLYDPAGNLIRDEFSPQQGRVDFVNDVDGHVMGSWRSLNGNTASIAYNFHYYAGGMQVGAVGNDGAPETDYATALAQRGTTPGNLFQSGAAVSYADFDQSFETISPTSEGAANGVYTVQGGDTLASIALSTWGDASLWYLIADANGLSGSEALAAGRILSIPAKVTNVHNSASTFKVYDPNKALGNTDPLIPAPPPQAASHHGGCGILGQILLVVVAVAVTYFTAGAATPAIQAALGAEVTATGAVIGGSAAAIAGGAIGGAIGAAAGSIVSQGVGLATGIQDKFSWKGVAFAAISGGVGGGIGASGVFGGVKSAFVQGALRGALGNAITQGVSIATGLQRRFDWTGVAVGGIVGGATNSFARDVFHTDPDKLNVGQQLVTGIAGAIAGSATRSLIDGTDFGDNILSTLPDVIGNTVGNLVADRIASVGRSRGGVMQTGAGDGTAAQPIAGAGGGQVGGSASGDAQPGDIVVTARRGGGYNPVSAAVAQVVAQTVAGSDGGDVGGAIDRGNHPYPVDPEDMSGNTAWQLRAKRAAYLDAVAQSGQTFTDNELNVRAFDDLIARADIREAPGVAAADAEVNEILRAGLVPVDIGMGGYNIATGNGGLRDYLAVGSVVPIGKVLGAVGVAARTEIKGFASYSALKRYLGSPGTGNQWHHIVEQTPGNLKAFGADVIHSTDNVVAIPASTHIGKGSISAYYSSKDFFTNGQTVRQWLSTQSLQAQRQFGLDTLKRFGK